jgi:uncharacterized protein (DUF433 family)
MYRPGCTGEKGGRKVPQMFGRQLPSIMGYFFVPSSTGELGSSSEQAVDPPAAAANMIEAVEKFMTVDWSECELVESVAEKVGGGPVVKGARVPADTILTDQELGATVEETHESFPSLSVETIRSLRAYGRSRKFLLKP